MITAPKSICNKFWETGEWATSWTQSLVTNPSQEKEPSTVQELPHNQVDVPFKQSHVEEIVKKTESLSRQTRKNIAIEWTGFRVGCWTGQIFNFRLLCDRFLQNQKDRYVDRYVDCTKAFDRYCKKPNLIRVKESKTKSTWRLPDCDLPWWQQRRPVRQRCLFLQSLSLTSSSTEFWLNDGRWDIEEQSAS